MSLSRPAFGRVRELCINESVSRPATCHQVAVGGGYGAIEGAPPPTAQAVKRLKKYANEAVGIL